MIPLYVRGKVSDDIRHWVKPYYIRKKEEPMTPPRFKRFPHGP